MNEHPAYTADEFENEARYLDTLIWEAIVVVPGSNVLICGYGPDGQYVRRARDAGANVTVIEHRNESINRFSKLDAKLLRGSTSVIPARDNTYDLAIAYHYLHEVDPFFHTQVLSELARVARRVAVVEPAPPSDPLGRRIALLYSQAKRELGQFEYYQPLEHWKKLLQGVKADVSQHVFAFAKTPPREYLSDTVALLLDTIEIEAAPREFMTELREIAQRSDAQLLPPPRFVLVGAAAGELLAPNFTPRIPARPAPPPTEEIPIPAAVGRRRRGRSAEISADSGYEMPPVENPVAPTPVQTTEPAPEVKPAAKTTPASPSPGSPASPAPTPAFGMPGLPFGAPPPPVPGSTPPAAPFGVPFSAPPGAAPSPPGGMTPTPGWQWEPPDGAQKPPEP